MYFTGNTVPMLAGEKQTFEVTPDLVRLASAQSLGLKLKGNGKPGISTTAVTGKKKSGSD